ncbi:hypothetical protein [Elizabethkingia anophelis]|uniref:hypothetical protein n=1 Tax=Elizabethkingia anophelis TaxID=1117645 RepID=UPI0004E440CB|nr:hypothetical protein [Elizabethkingia anophelis]KFC33458.1 hypothetical protein FF18_08640 [Elizabethkingia anophelis]MCT3786910.1 hypothetical protein [Elizabethkingia anophelis]MDV3500901.1 hypothetical protein [Elizabethkingia anophelis]PKR29622.1 hypothetical protein CWH99_01960 [Elizabethkingia anophelis]PKR35237.1 hypothetical protein CWI00_11340 [Elizabethkingia anophelis]
MIFRIDSHNASILTREELTISQWIEKFDQFICYSRFINESKLVEALTFEYNLNVKQITMVEELLKNKTIKYFRISSSKYEHFKIDPVYLDIKNNKGKLIYWKDWDYVFQEIENEYFLWCFLGGIADIQREIKLSKEHIRKYHEIGLAQIDYLIDNIKKLNDSVEYKNAIEENRRIR